MNFTFDELKLARDREYSDDEIWGKLIERDNSLSVAKERGYSLEEVASKLSGRPIPQEPEPEPSGFLRQAADIPIKVGEGLVGSVKSFADLFGADNAVSKNLAGYEEWVGGLVSAESKQDSKEIARILKDAEDKGVYDKVIAGLEAFSKAPLEMSAQSVGYMIPQLAAGVLGKAAQFTKAGIIGTQAAIGFAQGVGMIKGDIYTATTDYLREKGVPEDKIEPIATKAQSYGGGNLDQMLIGGGLLAVDAITGADAILTRVLTKQGKPVSDGIIKGIIKGGLKEGAIEVPQEGQQQVATNVALQREGYDVPTYQGAVQRAAVGGFAGFAMGSVLGGFEAMSPERKAEIKIDEAADKAARDLETPSDDPAAMALSTEITRNQDAIENLRLDLDAMEPNDPRAQKLRFDISDRQKALTDLQLQYQKLTGNDQEIPAVSIAASRRMEIDNKIETLTEEIGMDEEALTLLGEGSQERIDAQAALDKKRVDLDTVSKEAEGLSLTIKPPVAEAATPSATIEEAKTKVEQLNTEFDALDENDQAGIDRVNTQIFAEQNKIAELTAIEQGVEPQGTTPTREMGLPPSGRRSPFGTLYRTDETGKAERPILQAFMSATDKVIAALPAFNKGTQKLKNAIRTGIANNAGFLAGTNTKVITSEDYGKLTGRKQTASDTYKAVFLKGQKYLVVPDINQLAGISIKGEQRAASKDAALDQESRAAAKKLEEEVIHLSMFQGIQDEYKALKNPKLSEQEYVVKRLSDIVKEVKRTNPNALPGVSNAYLNDNSKLLDDMTFSQEFMRMVIQRVRTGQITEDLNAIRQAEQEAFSDKDKGAIISLKNSILNALRVVRDSITRYLGKGTSTKEVEKMKNAINAILDEYGIVKGEANYEFQDYSAAQPKGEVSLTITPTEEAAPEARPLPTDQLPTETPGARYGREAEVFDVFSEAKRKPVELIPNSEVTEEVEAINSLPDNATYEEIQRVAPATIINLKAASQYVSGSFSEFQKIILNSFKSLKRFAETIWKGIRIPLIAITSSTVVMGPFIASDYFALSGPEGRSDLRETGLILKPTNIFKPYIRNISVEQLDKSLQTPEETLKLIRDAIKQSKPFSGKIDFDFSSLSKFFEGLDVNNIPAGNKKIAYNYNNLIETSNDEIKSAAEFLKSASSRTQEIESRLREIMGAMEFFTKRNFNDVRFKIKDQHLGQPETRRNGNALESAVFVALARNGGMISSLSFYNNKTNTINLDPQTLISILDNTNAATNAAQHIANELTHALQYQTNKGKPIGLLSIKLSDYDTASTALWMRIDMYSQYGKEFQLINAESNWGDILVKKYFNAKHKIQPKSFAQITNDQPRIKQALENKQTEAFINEIFSYGGISAEEIIEAKAGVTPQVQYAEAINGDTGNDTITPKTNQETWAKSNPESASEINSLILQRLREVGHLWKGGMKMPMFKAASKDFDSAGGDVGSFFAETKEHAMSYLERGGKIFSAYIKMDNPANSSDVVRVLSKAFPQYAEQFRSDQGDWGSVMSTGGINDGAKFVEAMQDAGYDGVYQWDGADAVAVVFNPNQAKSADLATFDKKGQVIPISERFSPESPLMARAGVTPQPSARSVKIEKKITQQIINDIEGLIDDLKPKKNKSGQPYVSRTTLKGETYAKSLVSPFSKAVNLYTMTGHESALSAFNKVLKGNPDASFFDIASNLTLRDENGEPVVTYGLSKEELPNLIHLLNIVAPTYRQMVMDSDASFEERSRIALSMPAIEFGLTKAVVKIMQAAGRTLNLAKTLRQIGGYGMAVANYKSNVQKSIGNLWSKIGGDMNDIASYARGDRRKAVDNVASLSKVISKLVSLQRMAIKNPEKARDSIRKAISRKKTEATKKILLAFSASTFDDKTEKFSNMIIDETAKAILSIGTKKGSSNTDSTYKKIYKAISSVAKQTAQEEEKKKQEAEGQPKAKKQAGKREGKFLEQVGMVIGNDKTYKQFMDEVRKSIRQEYQSDADFNTDYKDLFDKLSNREWSESMRQQAIKDSADALDYKFAELFQYIGSQRNAAQESVKTHMRFELQSMGATAEMVDKFTADVDNYLNEETRKVLEKKLGFVVDKETGKITGGQIIKDKMKELSTTEGQFKLAKTLKGLTRLAASDQRNFIDKLNELIITELGFDDTASSELSKIIEGEITKAVTAQQSQNLKQAIARVTKTLDDNNIKAKGTQRTILKRLIELANMGQLDDMKVYEAFRQTHNFGKGYLEYNPDMVQTLREWGDRISALPEGVMRGIEEQKLGRYMLEQGVFTTTDYLSSYWYFALLSQVGTQAINVMGSTFNLMGNIATWGLYTKGKSLGPMMRGLHRAISGKQSPALNSFLYVMQTGLNPSGLQDEKMMIYPKGNVFENSTPENVPKLVYKLITFGADSVQSPALNAILNTMSPRGMMRLMRASDMYMREVAYEVRAASLGATEFSQEQYDAAFRQAEAEMQGSKSATREKKKEIIIRANEIIAEKRLEAVERESRLPIKEYAEQDSLEVAYSQKTAGLVGLIASFANKMLDAYPATRLFIPFTNVVANVLNENLNYAPLISQYRLMQAVELSPLLKGKIKLRPGSEKNPFIQGREDKAGALAIKSVIGLAASSLPFIIGAIAGGDDEDQDKERPFVQFYSQGPKDPEQNKIWSENGGTKYSIRFGNTYISYLFTPLVIPLSYGQMLKQEYDAFQKKASEKGIGDVTELVIKALASPVAIGFVAALDQSFLTGISDLIELKEARDLPKAGAGIARNIISRMLVPGVGRDIQKLMVDERLEGDLYITNMLKEFPGSSAFLDKDLNYFGDKARYNSIMQEDGFTRRAFSLVGRIAATEKPDPAFEILYKNGITPPNWNQSLKWSDKTSMNKAEQREFIATAGPRMRQFIIDNESTISMLDTEDAQSFVSNNFSAIRKNAKGMMEMNRTK